MPTENPITGKSFDEAFIDRMMSHVHVVANHLTAMQNYCAGYTKYLNDFMIPFLVSTNYFSRVEQDKLLMTSPLETFQSYMDLLRSTSTSPTKA
jgi:polyphosphate kinase